MITKNILCFATLLVVFSALSTLSGIEFKSILIYFMINDFFHLNFSVHFLNIISLTSSISKEITTLNPPITFQSYIH